MKKYIVAGVLTLLSISSFAQKKVGTLSLTPRIGVSIANMTNMEMGFDSEYSITDSRYKAGFTGGIEAEYQFHPMVSASLGTFYGMQGCLYPDQETGTDTNRTGWSDFKVDAQYIHAPLLAHVYVTPRLALKAGVDVAFLLTAKAKGETTPITVDENGAKTYGTTEIMDMDLKDSFRSVCVSIPVGVSYEYMNVVLDARYHIPVTDAMKKPYSGGKHQYWTFTLGYKFRVL